MEEEENNQYTPIVEEAFSHELKKFEPPTLMQYLRSLRNNQYRKDELNRLFGQGPIIRDPRTNEAYTNPLTLLGDTMDTVNDQVTLKNISPVLHFLPEDNMPNKLKDIMNYSLKDAQYDAMGFVEDKAKEHVNTGIPALDKVIIGGAVIGTALAVPDATDVFIPGASDALKASRKVDWNKLIDWTQESGNSLFNRLTNPNWRLAGAGDAPIDGSMMMSKSDDALGGFSKNIRKTSPEYENLVLSGMERMGMKDGVFDINLYNKNSPILNEMSDPLGGTVMKSGMRRGKKLSKRNWMEYFLSPESLKGNFESLRKSGKVAADLEWGDFLKSKNLKIGDIQAHHINPLYDSMHLFDGIKWGSDEYWEVVSTLINRGARPGVVQRGDNITNIVRTFGKSSLTDTPHGIAHEFYRDVMPTFFSKKEVLKMKGNHKYRMEKAARWAGIVRRSEDILIESHKAWKSLNPKTRMDFNELVETMSKYDNKGIIKGIHQKYQVKDIQELVKEVQYQDFMDRLNIEPSLVDQMRKVDFEFMEDVIKGMSKKELTRKWGKKYKLKAIGAKQLSIDDILK